MGGSNGMNPKVPKKMQSKRCKRCDKSLDDVRYRGCIVRKYCFACSVIVRREYHRNRQRVKHPKKGLTKCFTCRGSMSYNKSKFCCERCMKDHYRLIWLQESIDTKTKFLKKQKLKRQKILDHYRNVQELVSK